MSDKPANPSVFLERQSYRRNRLGDAARLLPVVGMVVLSVPLLWPSVDSVQVVSGVEQAVPMSTAIRYIFGAWAGLIVLSALFGMAARRWGGQSDAPNRTALNRAGPD